MKNMDVLQVVKTLKEAEYIAETTDGWTSRVQRAPCWWQQGTGKCCTADHHHITEGLKKNLVLFHSCELNIVSSVSFMCHYPNFFAL